MTEDVCEMIGSVCVGGAQVSPETRLMELNLDSLSFVQLLVELEQRYEIEFQPEELNFYDYATAKDVIDLVEEKRIG